MILGPVNALAVYTVVCVLSSLVLVVIDRRERRGDADRLSTSLGCLSSVQPLMALGLFAFPLNLLMLAAGVGFEFGVLWLDRRLRDAE